MCMHLKVTYIALTLSVAADVPSLINYQGRLVDGVGNPIVGKKEFELDIYDSQTEGTLIYQETLPEITLDEDGAYSFQFGAGESRSETSVVIATGDGEAAFFQKVFEETPVGVISVTDGTNTFKTGDVPTGEEPFNFTYTASLKRLNLVCNDPPAVGVSFTATYRYNEAGIVGALGTAAEHWMEVTIGGEKQEPRQRLVAVPFALKAGSLVSTDTTKSLKLVKYLTEYPWTSGIAYLPVTRVDDRALKLFEVPASALFLKKISVPTIHGIRARLVRYDYDRTKMSLSERITEIASIDNLEPSDGSSPKEFNFEVNLPDSSHGVYYIELTKIVGAGSGWILNGPLLLEYKE
jgi:hypothetical protein